MVCFNDAVHSADCVASNDGINKHRIGNYMEGDCEA
jgi:hypothetical protein